MFQSLVIPTPADVSAGCARNNGTLYSRVSTGVAGTDSAFQYMGHVDIPRSAFAGFSTTWQAQVSVVYEAGAYGGVSANSAPTAPSTSARRFSIRVGAVDGTDPTVMTNTTAVIAPAEYKSGIGGQFSGIITAVDGSAGNEVRVTAMYDSQGTYNRSGQALNHLHAQFGTQGLRVAIFFAWESPYVTNEIMKVVSTSVRVVPGDPIVLVTPQTPRTLTLTMFGGHWAGWPTTVASASSVPLGQIIGSARFFADWTGIETVNWTSLTDAQRNADTGWTALDQFVAGHSSVPGRKMVVCLNLTAQWYSGGNMLNPPSDLASGSGSSWYRFCRLVATRYAGKNISYEIWNEPSGTSNIYVGFTGTPAQLAEMFSQASTAIRAADPTAKVLTSAFTNIVNFGSFDGVEYIRAALSAGGGIMRTGSDAFNYHAYAVNNIASAYNTVLYLRNIRTVLKELGSPTKPILMSESSAGTPNWSDLDPVQRRVYMARAQIAGLLADPYTQGYMWYGLNQTNYGWNQADVNYWNELVAFLISGVTTSAVINLDGSVSITVNGVSKRF